ncbi:MAG: two-component system response regulator NarL [Burkholderiales bacterium]|nr:two-component system response regulator NarL [Burkholderiales bacterium]
MPNSNPTSLLIVDDHPLFRKGVVQLVESAGGFVLLGEASSGAEGIELANALHPDMILLDLNMKDMSGVDVLKMIKAADLDSRVIMLTVSDQQEDLVAALRAGADGYLLKDMEPEDLVAHLKEAARGQMVLSPALAGLLAHALRQENKPKTVGEAGLTEQEKKIIERIAAGKSNKLIARELNIAEGTVKVHVKHLLKKLNLKSRVEAAVWAVTPHP